MASITKRGKFWRARVRIRGQLLTKTLDTEAEARAWAAAEEARITKGATAVQVRKMPSGITIADLFAKYAREVSPEKGGARWERIRLRAIAPTLPVTAIEVDGAALAEWRDATLKQVSASSVNGN